MSETGIKSKPIYRDLEPDPAAQTHLLAGEGAGASALVRLCQALQTQQGGSVSIDYTAGPGPDRAADLHSRLADAVRIHADREALAEVLRQALAGAGMSVRLYLAGSEPFLWTLALTARDMGMPDSAIRMQRCGPLARRVQCVHCKTTADWVERTIYQCPGCALHLMVRDHFSPRLGLYQGVCVDAEEPGVIPPAEEFEA
ncbi:dimethylamine monooxygenase subunit DmmA family protein [Aquisalimonas asiatica]|uniref:Uncharacterized protein n=1 Tax=Aquisalimonas asiatica TaxID=406100 RepID=A0A1H8PZV7_9GAMM|nr:dimethylamine monooxygenase subunit DmmA family protein [Aquisalimonas asiatica]SEO47271.1 hypothetical protein SAMN04488052_101251 [Aquisalimonas asiatica]